MRDFRSKKQAKKYDAVIVVQVPVVAWLLILYPRWA